jgi:hypothetical protein
MFPVGYSIKSTLFCPSIYAKVKGPTLPTNIVIIIVDLLTDVRSDVIPVESPTVPKADTTSKSIFIKLVFSDKVRVNIITAIRIKDKKTIAFAFEYIDTEIALLKRTLCFFPLILENIYESTTTKVDVLIPPPVEPGDAPININIIVTNKLD